MYRVLLVEDDTALQFIYKKMKAWSECGFTVSAQASNGSEALRILEKESVDLIFTDIRMPLMDGIEFLQKLKSSYNTTPPVIFASSYDEFEYARQGLILGAFDYLLKPIDEKKLTDVLLRVKEHIIASQKAKIDPAVTALLDELGLSSDTDEFVKQISEYCSANYTGPLTCDDFAEEQGYNKDYFGKVFKQHFNMTVRQFCLRVKISYACELLRTGTHKAYEVSDILGFSSYKYFNEKFKAVTGVAPSDYKYGIESRK